MTETSAEMEKRHRKERCVFPKCDDPTSPTNQGHIHVNGGPHVSVEHDNHAGEYCDMNAPWCHPFQTVRQSRERKEKGK